MAKRIGGYEQLTELQTVGSGSARWCIVSREGQRYFLKEFLAPVYPDASKQTTLVQQQRQRCEVFERDKRHMYAAISCVIGDTLVPVLDFFRHGRRYYAISQEVPAPHISGEEVEGLSPREKRELLFHLALCLQRLHAQGIIHADLKPEHLLLVGKPGHYKLRLIDLDSSLLEEEMTRMEREMEGDPAYLAPEVFLRMMGEDVQPTARLDTFALGMIIHRLWTGELPAFDTEQYAYLYEAVLADGEVRLSQALPLAYRIVVQRMLRKDPEERPEDDEIVQLLSAPRAEAAASPEGEDAPLNSLSRYLKAKKR